MKLERRTEMADRVVAAVKKVAQPDPVLQLTLTTYRNGRENGYTLTNWMTVDAKWRAVTFAEHRNSDDLAVYWGDWAVMDTEVLYGGKSLFRTDTKAALLDVASRILRFLVTGRK